MTISHQPPAPSCAFSFFFSFFRLFFSVRDFFCSAPLESASIAAPPSSGLDNSMDTSYVYDSSKKKNSKSHQRVRGDESADRVGHRSPPRILEMVTIYVYVVSLMHFLIPFYLANTGIVRKKRNVALHCIRGRRLPGMPAECVFRQDSCRTGKVNCGRREPNHVNQFCAVNTWLVQ